MHRKHHTRGVVISIYPEGEHNLRASIFTENFGLLNARLQGGRSVYSKLRPGSQPFTLGEFSLIHGRSGWKIVSARAEKNCFENLRHSRAKLEMVANILRLLDRLTAEDLAGANKKVFEVLEGFLNFLDSATESEIFPAECLTLLRLLHLLGYLRHDPEMAMPLLSAQINETQLQFIGPRRRELVELINEALRASQS